MGWPSSLTYEKVVALKVARSVNILAHYGDVDTAERVFADNAALADDPEALAEAATNGHESFVRLMLRYQPNLAQRIAVVAKTQKLTEFLFQQGMDPNRSNWLRITPLHRFAEQGEADKAAMFIDHGADLHARDEELSSTPLAYAARSGKLAMVEFLLRRGAKPTLPDDPPWATPLAWATRRGYDKIVRLLTEYEQSHTLPQHELKHYERLSSNLVEAYRSGDEDALAPLLDHFNVKRPMTWDRPPVQVRIARLRRYVQDRLGTRSDMQIESNTLALADAQLLIARSSGFDSWPDLVKHSKG